MQVLYTFLVISMTYGCNSGSNPLQDSETNYQRKIQSVEEMEMAYPTKFLSSTGTYRENFFGDKLKLNGVVRNSVIVASYKDAIIRIHDLSKTGTVLGSKDYTLYKYFYPQGETRFNLKIQNFRDVSSISIEGLDAIPVRNRFLT